jgi:hypothetical protein
MMRRGVLPFLGMMRHDQFLQAMEEQKPDYEGDHGPRGILPVLLRQGKNLGEDVKTHDA